MSECRQNKCQNARQDIFRIAFQNICQMNYQNNFYLHILYIFIFIIDFFQSTFSLSLQTWPWCSAAKAVAWAAQSLADLVKGQEDAPPKAAPPKAAPPKAAPQAAPEATPAAKASPVKAPAATEDSKAGNRRKLRENLGWRCNLVLTRGFG